MKSGDNADEDRANERELDEEQARRVDQHLGLDVVLRRVAHGDLLPERAERTAHK